MFTKLLVAYDGSDGAERALRAGIDLAKSLGQDLYAVMVEEDLPHYAGTLDEVDAIKEQKDAYFGQLSREAIALAEGLGVALHTEIIAGHEVGAIVEYVKKHGFNLLIVGKHGHSALYERVIGTTAHGIMSHSPCSVLVVVQ